MSRSTRAGMSTPPPPWPPRPPPMLALRRWCRLSSCRREAAACACTTTACSSAGATAEPWDRLSDWLWEWEQLGEGDAGRGEAARRPVLAALAGPLLVVALPSSASGVEGPVAAAAPSRAVTVSGEPAALACWCAACAAAAPALLQACPPAAVVSGCLL